MDGISIILCCHNSLERLPETLAHLAAQDISPSLDWEVIIVDNASSDRTSELAPCLWTRPDVPLRVFLEPKAGKSHALECGIKNASLPIIGIIDDDNWVPADWLQRVWIFFADHPTFSLLGCASDPVFESNAPSWFASISKHFAIGSQFPFSGDITEQRGTLLWGAGMAMRRNFAMALFNDGFKFLMSSGAGKAVGEDVEHCFAFRAAGAKIWYQDDLRIKHFVPAARLGWDYAVKLMRGMGRSSAYLDIYLIAFERHPYEQEVRSYKKIWQFQFLKSAKDLVKLIVSQPWACLFQSEGSDAVLRWAKEAARVSSIFNLRKQYKPLIRAIRSARWNRTTPV